MTSSGEDCFGHPRISTWLVQSQAVLVVDTSAAVQFQYSYKLFLFKCDFLYKASVCIINKKKLETQCPDFSASPISSTSFPVSLGLPAVARILRPLYDSAGKDGGCTSRFGETAW